MQTAPNFCIIGAARTGTSWLRNSLARHPRVFVLWPEQNYLMNGKPDQIAARIELAYNYNPHFTGGKTVNEARGQSGVIFGEKSPLHLVAPVESIRTLHELYPNLKIVVGIREPMSRALSHLVNRRIDYSKPVDTKLMDKIIPLGRYERSLRKWASVFAPSKILLYPFEELRANPLGTIRRVSDHLGLGSWDASDDAPRKSPTDPRAHPALPPHPQVLGYLREHVGADIYDIDALQRVIAEAWHQANGAPVLSRL